MCKEAANFGSASQPLNGPLNPATVTSRVSTPFLVDPPALINRDKVWYLHEEINCIPSHAGLCPRISIRVWPITGSRSTKSLASILMFIGLAPSCGR